MANQNEALPSNITWRCRLSLAFFALLLFFGCGSDETVVVVDVVGLPSGAHALQVTASLDGQVAQDSGVFTEELTQFGVRFPRDRRGALDIYVDVLDASSCSLARGQAQLLLNGQATYQVSLMLVALPATLCKVSIKKINSGSGSVMSGAGGIDCGATCTGYFILGQQVTLSARAATDSHFLGWSGVCGGTDTCSFTVKSAVEITANFTRAQSRLCPQSGWCWENPLSHGIYQSKIWGTSGRNLFSVGAVGTILHWDGQSWSAMPSGTVENLQRVGGIAGGAAWIVGNKGTILRFADGEWKATASGTQNTLFGVFGFSDKEVWAVGENRTILHWDGTSWTPANFTGNPPATVTLYGVWGSRPDALLAVGSGGAVYRYDGVSWTLAQTLTGLTLRAVSGSSATDVWVAASEGVLAHYDGSAWTNFTPTPVVPYYDISVGSPGQIWAVGQAGQTLRFETNKWTQYLSGVSQDLLGVYTEPGGDAWAVGGAGTVLHWQSGSWLGGPPSGVLSELRDVWGTGSDNIWAVGAQGALLHGQAGTYTPVAGTTLTCDAVYGIDATNVWAACQNMLYKWSGADWRTEFTGPAGTVWGGLWASGGDIWAVGNGGITYRKRGTGAWLPVTSTTGNSLFSVGGSSPTDLWAVGFNGTILHGDGNSWTASPSGTTQALYSVVSIGPNQAWAVGNGGTILRWDGLSWSPMTSPSPVLLRHIHGSAANNLWIAGASGVALHFDGSAWSSIAVGYSSNLRGVWAFGDEVYMVGDFGTILHHVP